MNVKSRSKSPDDKFNKLDTPYSQIFQQTTASIVVYDKNGTIIDVNPHFVEVTFKGSLKEAFIGHNIFKDTPGTDIRFNEATTRLLNGEATFDENIYFPAANGHPEKFLNIRGVPLFKDGKVVGGMHFVEDITAQKKAEELMEFHSNLISNIDEGILVNDIDLNIVYFNDYCARFLGYTREEMSGLTLKDVVSHDTDGLEKIRNAIDSTGEGVFESFHVRKGGTKIPVEVRAKRIHFNDRDLVISSIRDLTLRNKYRESLEFHSQVLNAVNDGITVHDTSPDRNIIFYNDYFRRSLGYTIEEMADIRAENFIAPEIPKPVIDEKELKGTEGSIIESVHVRKDGTSVPVEVNIRTIEINGKTYVIHSARDITERKKAEQTVQISNQKLRETLTEITQAIASTIEVRDPYTAGHQLRAAKLARAIALEMGLPPEHADQIYTAATIHDIGKIGIPAEILSKPGKLNSIEYSLIKLHPQAGYDILKNINFSYPLARWVLEHHERLNGSGYPSGLKGEQISLEGRILAVADVVEAISSHRPYRSSLGSATAIQEITRNKNTKFDANVVDACFRLFYEKGYKVE